MLPIGPLMIEHRTIEKMISRLSDEGERMERERTMNAGFLETAIDFIRTYADLCHHGKEEDILIKHLQEKKISREHQSLIDRILKDHRDSRNAVAELESSAAEYFSGNRHALPGAVRCIRFLRELYPRHIATEDRHFFLPVMTYFTDDEKNSMLREGYDFDRTLIHVVYRRKIDRAGQGIFPVKAGEGEQNVFKNKRLRRL